ncbi:hypothetical protein Droror1_Dr00008382 [Drosera rotundifolia]
MFVWLLAYVVEEGMRRKIEDKMEKRKRSDREEKWRWLRKGNCVDFGVAATAHDSGCFTSQPREPSRQRHDQRMEDAWAGPAMTRPSDDDDGPDESGDDGGNKNEGGGAVWIRVSGTSCALMRKGNCELMVNKNDEHIGPR